MIQVLFYLIVSGLLSYRWAGALRAAFTTQLFAAVTLLLTLWFVPLQLLGVVTLVTGYSVVTVGNAVLLLLAVLLIDVVLFRRRAVEWRIPLERFKEFSLSTWLLLVPVAGVVAWIVGFGLSHPPVGWDNFHYHLPRALNFMHHQSLTEYLPPPNPTLAQIENALGYNACHAYPGNWSLYLSLLTRAKQETLITLAQFPFLLVGALVVFRLARLMGVGMTPAIAAVAIASTGPLVLAQSIVPYTDLFCAVFLLGTLIFLLERSQGQSLALATLAGLSLGLAVGAKSTSLAYGLLLGIAACCLFASRHWRSPSRGFPQLLVFGLMILVPSAFWFGQNWLLYGSPVVPWQLKVAGITLFAGKDPALFDAAQEWVYVSTRRDWLTYAWTEKFNNESGFGWLWATALPLGAFGAAWALIADHERKHQVVAAVLSFFGLASLILWWKLTHHEPRYMMQVIGVVAILAAYGLHRLAPRVRMVAVGLILLGIMANWGTSISTLGYRKVEGWTRNDYVASVSRTPPALLNFLDQIPSVRIFNEKHGLVESTVVAYALQGSKYQHQVLEDQNLLAEEVDEMRRNLLSRKVDHLFIITREGDPYLQRYSREKGFETRYQGHYDGLVQTLFRVYP